MLHRTICITRFASSLVAISPQFLFTGSPSVSTAHHKTVIYPQPLQLSGGSECGYVTSLIALMFDQITLALQGVSSEKPRQDTPHGTSTRLSIARLSTFELAGNTPSSIGSDGAHAAAKNAHGRVRGRPVVRLQADVDRGVLGHDAARNRVGALARRREHADGEHLVGRRLQ